LIVTICARAPDSISLRAAAFNIAMETLCSTSAAWESRSTTPAPPSSRTQKVTPVLDRTYPLADTAEGLRYVKQGQARGKVVITMA
jgi:hypothetical protein